MIDADVPISEAQMVQTICSHMGKSSIMAKANQKFKKHVLAHPEDKTWTKAKEWFRDKLKEIQELNKEAGLDTPFQASNLTKRAEEEQQKVREQIVVGL